MSKSSDGSFDGRWPCDKETKNDLQVNQKTSEKQVRHLGSVSDIEFEYKVKDSSNQSYCSKISNKIKKNLGLCVNKYYGIPADVVAGILGYGATKSIEYTFFHNVTGYEFLVPSLLSAITNTSTCIHHIKNKGWCNSDVNIRNAAIIVLALAATEFFVAEYGTNVNESIWSANNYVKHNSNTFSNIPAYALAATMLVKTLVATGYKIKECINKNKFNQTNIEIIQNNLQEIQEDLEHLKQTEESYKDESVELFIRTINISENQKNSPSNKINKPYNTEQLSQSSEIKEVNIQ